MLSKQKQTHMVGNQWKRKKLFRENSSEGKNKLLDSLWACFSFNDSVRPAFFFFFPFYPLTDWTDILPGTQYVPQGTHLFPFRKIETPSCISCLNYDPTEYPNVQARGVRIILGPSSFSPINPVSFLLICLRSHFSNLPPSCLCLLPPHLWSDTSGLHL